jgi:membrane-bound lytic murein transglycosylase D
MPLDKPAELAKAEPAIVPIAALKDQPPVPSAETPAQTPAPTPAIAVAAPPPPLPNIWDRIRAGYRLPNLDGALVLRQEQWYSANPDYVARMVERGSLFLYYVVEEVERRKMPTEIALLPMIESAYNPQAYSRSHASGMWQFIPSTGKIYGLRQNFWYDGRRDVLAATSAALDYLEKLHNQFGDWTLALAAYNWGEGAVSRAVARNQARGLPTDYESLAMPLETRNYVPKLQAVKNIIAKPGQYGIALADIPNQPYFATVTTRRHIDVQLAASLAEMSLEEFRFLNPAHNKPVIKADGSETIVLPIEKVAVFQNNLDTHSRPLVSWQAYTMKRSDQPEKIASKHGMTLVQLKEANAIPGNKKIVAGQTLLVPLRDNADPHLPDLPAPKLAASRAKPKRAKCYHVSNNGAKKQVACATTPKKQQPATVARSKSTTPGSGVSVRALTGG